MFQKAFKIYEASIFVSCSLPLMVCCLRDQDGLVISNTNVSYGKLKRIMTKRHVVKALFFYASIVVHANHVHVSSLLKIYQT